MKITTLITSSPEHTFSLDEIKKLPSGVYEYHNTEGVIVVINGQPYLVDRGNFSPISDGAWQDIKFHKSNKKVTITFEN